MALSTALTRSDSGAGRLMTTYYDKLFLAVAESKLVHKQLGQLNRKIGQGEGGYGDYKVQWTRWVNLSTVTAGSGEGVPTSACVLSAVAVTGTTAQYDNAVSISDILAYAGFGDVMKAAIERLAYNAGISIDTVVRTEVWNSGTAMNASASSHYSSMYSTAVLAIGPVRRAIRSLQRNDAMEINGGGWVAVIHPDQLYDLQGDTTTAGWAAINTYNASNNNVLSGEVGKLMGVRFLVSSNGKTDTANTAYAASATYYIASFFGRDAFGVTELQGLKTYIKNFGSGGVGDPTDKIATAGWKTTFGVATLNANFFVNMRTCVTSTA